VAVKQVVITGGRVQLLDVPAPQPEPRGILVRVEYSTISVGTEIAGVRSASMPLYRRALEQPAKVRRALQLVRERGLRHTIERARGETSAVPLGYSASGTVLTVGAEVEEFRAGDRVACAGAGIANHAEVIAVPLNLAVRIPAEVDSADASTVALGAIALQGIRRAAPELGETVLVVGLGLIGQVTVQLLRANGCRTIGVDPDPARLAIARAAGMDAAVGAAESGYSADVLRLTDGYGADAAIVTAATPSHEVINQAMEACRRKGRVVLVGDVGLNLVREQLYAKELDFLISTSYGPGRYDPLYEAEGRDYPLPYVRWTENRNMAAYLDLVASGRISLANIPRRTWAIADASAAYAELSGPEPKPLLALLSYPSGVTPRASRVELRPAGPSKGKGPIRVALVGSGSFAQAVHVPNLVGMKPQVEIRAVANRTGSTARMVAEKVGAAYATSDYAEVLADDQIELVFIATRHHLHAELALAALKAGKHVFVEKPMAISEDQLQAIEAFYEAKPSGPVLFTGFNRRFSPAAKAARTLLAERKAPAVVSYRVNAGFIPPEHWVHGPEGGGRNIGEACHFYDLFNYLVGRRFTSVSATSIVPTSRQLRRDDNFVATVRYEDGSVCSLTYCALGSSAFPKESMEVFVDGLVLSLDDYRSLKVWGGKHGGWQGAAPDKGHAQELAALAEGVRSGKWAIPLAEQIAATRISFTVQEALRQ
jgi:predicted dehydrogenase/threonine dehydrogenase-like Zn-dependent dehydrogenase